MIRLIAFTPEVLFRLFDQYNAALWPLPLLAFGLALLAVLLAWKPRLLGGVGSDRAVAAILAVFWLWTGVVFHGLYFSGINFIAPVYALLFVAQGLLLAWTGVVRGRLSFRFAPTRLGWAGIALAVLALAVYPLAGFLAGHGWARASLLLPSPLVLFTLAMLALSPNRTPLRLIVIPVFWCLVAGLSGWLLNIVEDLILPLAGIAAAVLIVWKNRRAVVSHSPVSGSPTDA